MVIIDFGHARARAPDETDDDWRKAKIKAAEEFGIAEGLCKAIEEGLKDPCRFHGSQCRHQYRHTSALPFYYVGKRKYGHVSAKWTGCALWHWSIENRFNAAMYGNTRATRGEPQEDLRRSEEPGDIPEALRQVVEDWRSTIAASDSL